MSRLLLPVNTADAQRYGLKLAGGETVNALGAILTALASISPATTVQDTVDDAVYQGSTIVLARLQASDFQSDPATAGQTWVGQKVSCCPTAGGNKQTCKEEALGSCFGGSHPFAVDGSAAQSSLLSGQLSGGKLSMTASMLRINLPLTSAGVMELTLRSVQLRGTLSEGGLREGALAGTITRSEVDQKLLPSMAQMLDAMIKDAATAPEMKDFLGTVFDRDKDGGITVTEVRESSIRSLLTGDVDTDRDGEKELSLGIGFEGVSAVIQGK